MSRTVLLVYTLWCAVIVAAFALADSYGYSPFAGGGRPVFTRGPIGPHHK